MTERHFSDVDGCLAAARKGNPDSTRAERTVHRTKELSTGQRPMVIFHLEFLDA